MKKFSTTVIIVIVFAMALSFWIIPDREQSEMENRKLAQMPTLTVGSYVNGTYKASFEEYVADQFPLRDLFLKVYRIISSKKLKKPGAEFKQIIEGTDGFNYYIFDENQILKVYADKKDILNAKQWAEKLTEVSLLCEENSVDLFIDFIPSKSESLNEMLPDGINDNMDEPLKEYIFNNTPSSAIIIDTMTEFGKMSCDEKADLYFRTDHHWNMRGAYKGFKYLCSSLGVQTKLDTDIAEYEFRSYPLKQSTLIGSYNRSLGDIFSNDEKLEYYMPDDLSVFDDITVENKLGEVQLSDVFAVEYEGEKVSYSTLNADDTDYLHLHNESAKNDYAICILKDSYFNALLPHISLVFSDVYVVDTRYYNDFVLEDFIADWNIDGIMMFYSSTAFLKCDEMLTYKVWG